MDNFAYNICENINTLLLFNEENGIIFFDTEVFECHNDLKIANNRLEDYVIKDLEEDNKSISKLIDFIAYLGYEITIDNRDDIFMKIRNDCQEKMNNYEDILQRFRLYRHEVMDWKQYFLKLKSYLRFSEFNNFRIVVSDTRKEFIRNKICSNSITDERIITDFLLLRNLLSNND